MNTIESRSVSSVHSDSESLSLRNDSTLRSWRVGLCLLASATAIALLLGTPVVAKAELRSHTVRWLPSPSGDVTGYVLSIGASSGSYSEVFDLGLPAVVSGEMSYQMMFESDLDVYMALRARNADGLLSDYSNEKMLAGVAASPPGSGDPGFGVTRITGLADTVNGEIIVEAEVVGATESVAFYIDGARVQVENAAPFSLAGDDGTTPNPFDTRSLVDGQHVLTAVGFAANDASGTEGSRIEVGFTVDNGLIAPPGGGSGGPGDVLEPIVAGIVASASGELSAGDIEGGLSTVLLDELVSGGDPRPIWCDLDGDDQRDLVVGFGRGSGAKLLLAYMSDRQVVSTRYLQAGTPRYASTNGETFPACGDLDGDGLAELTIGFGGGAHAHVQLFDDHERGFAKLDTALGDGLIRMEVERRFNIADINEIITNFRSREVPMLDMSGNGMADVTDLSFMMQRMASRSETDGSTHPAVGDVDGDGRDEIVVGFGESGGGILIALDDASAGFAPMPTPADGEGVIRVEGLASLADYDGALHPAIGDLDGDGLREIVVGLGAGGAGRIHALDDSTTGFTAIAGPAELDGGFHAGWAPYDAANGSTRVSLADVDGDDLAEVAVGFGEGGEHMLRLLDDVNTGFEPSTQSSAIEALVDFGEGQLVRPALNP